MGFGKTEVALRAVMKCVLAGKQAAILVPTTVLARQHYLTALQRFQGHPVTIELLTRYKTGSEQTKLLQKLEAGSVDIVIGTHKLFNKKIKFKDLGLLVVDEEQRFGVSHKETLKELSKTVDVLTLSATPIPRTLNMALSGIRDMSSIEEPPLDRHPVQTFVLEQNDGVLLDAIRRELSRGGQVYYLHNRVESIARCANQLQQRLPDARIGVVHGKMAQKEIASVMNAMADGEVDILVCTTIIETGIDIPNANTLIIENADNLGLAQLHQIRGRVGRSSRHAYAYLCYRRGKALSEIAQKRLSAIREYAAFGSGFKIAMRDLEIRGAGNVLGPEQSGHMMSVGYDLYLKLLEEAVQEEKGETPKPRVDCAAELAAVRQPAVQLCAGRGPARRPVPPHRAHPHRGAEERYARRADRPLRRAARRGGGAARYRAAAQPGERAGHFRDQTAGRPPAAHLRGDRFRALVRPVRGRCVPRAAAAQCGGFALPVPASEQGRAAARHGGDAGGKVRRNGVNTAGICAKGRNHTGSSPFLFSMMRVTA